MKHSDCENSKSLRVNQVTIQFTNKPITAWGGLAAIVEKLLEVLEFYSWVESAFPIKESSNNAKGIHEKVLAPILRVKESISSDRELSEKLATIKIYSDAIGIHYDEIPTHNSFNTLRQRLGPEGFVEIHRHVLFQAYTIGLLTPPQMFP